MTRTDSFIQKAKDRWGDKYDYSKVTYTLSIERIEIGCPVHGWVTIEARTHLKGITGCPKCGDDLHNEKVSTHGKSDLPEYKVWKSIKVRCKEGAPTLYTKKGIKVCQRWIDSFDNFLADMGKRPSKDYSIDRIDNNGDYCPENCRWATRKEQQNNRGCNVFTTYQGTTLTSTQWANLIGVKRTSIRNWIRDNRINEMFEKYQVSQLLKQTIIL